MFANSIAHSIIVDMHQRGVRELGGGGFEIDWIYKGSERRF